MIDEKFPILPLDDKPRFVVRKYWTGTVELLDVKSAGLGARRGKCNLRMYEV